MRTSATILAFGAAILAVPCASEALPEFDEDDFQVMSVEPGSNALVRSNDRDFYCSLLNKDGWYVAVVDCQPFVNVVEASEADKFILQLELEAAAAEATAEAEIAAAKAEADRAARSAAKVAREDAEARGFSAEGFSVAIQNIARQNDCRIEVGFNVFEDPEHFDPLLLEINNSTQLSDSERSAFVELAKSALASLYREDKIVYESTSIVRLKDCN